MDKVTKYSSVVKYLNGEIKYNELGEILLGEKDIDFFNKENYQKYIQQELKLLEDPEFYRYLVGRGCLITALREYESIIEKYLNYRNIHSDEIYVEREKIIAAISSLKDKDKLELLNYSEEEDEYADEYDTVIYNPITSTMDDEVLKKIILSLSEEERVKFLIDANYTRLYYKRLKNKEDKIEIFNSLSEENKLRIFSSYITIKDEDWEYKYIPFLRGEIHDFYGELVKNNLNTDSILEILKNKDDNYDYILEVLNNGNFSHGRLYEGYELIDILLSLDSKCKMEILNNSLNEYDYLLQILSDIDIQELVFDIKYIDDEVIEIVNKHLLHESDDIIKILGEKLKRIGKIDSKVLSVYRLELIEYLQNESDEKIFYLEETLKRLKNINEDILSTCKFELLTEKYRDLNSKLDVITCDVEVQDKILRLNTKQYRVLANILGIVKDDDIKDWIPIIDNLLRGLNNEKYKNLIESIDDKDLEDEAVNRKLAFILSNSENIFGIQSIEQVKDYNRIEWTEKIKKGELKTEYIKSLDKIEKLQLCVLERKYGLSLEKAKRLLQIYGKDLDEFEIDNERDEKIKLYLETIRSILNTNDESELEKLYNNEEIFQDNYFFCNIIESEIRAYFSRLYNKKIYDVKTEDRININLPLADGIPVYELGQEFMLEVTSLGAYSKYDISANFYDEWNRKLIKSHGFCTTPIANNNLATAKIKYVLLGFNNFSEYSLLLSAPWDIVSDEANQSMNTSQYFKDDRLLYNMPNKNMDNVRHHHPENVRERRALEDEKVYKKQPAYIVYIPQIPLEKYLELQRQGNLDNRDERNRLLQEYAKDDQIWANSVRASKEFATITESGDTRPLPIVIKDRTYNAIKEKEKIDYMEEEFRKTGDPNLINRIIVESENNRTGNAFYKEIIDNLFSSEILQERISRIEEIIKKIEKRDKKLADECRKMLIKTTIEEEEKYECFGRNKSLKTDKGYDHDKYINRWIEEFNTPNDINEFRKQCLGEKGKRIVSKIVDEIEEMEEYPNVGIHSKRHIQDVVLFSYMIANNEGKLDEESIGLLLKAAKYHDSGRSREFHDGRREDGEEQHALYSTIVAERDLRKQGMEARKIAMVNTAILYHEHAENNINEFDEKEFYKMCVRFGVEDKDLDITRLMCKYLKDADALDRVRLQGEATLKSRYLRTDTARALIGEARRINERSRKLVNGEEFKSVFESIDEDELKMNSEMISGKEREEASDVIYEMLESSLEMKK